MMKLPKYLIRGKPSRIDLRPRDKTIILAVHRFRLLTSEHLATLTGSNHKSSRFTARLRQLFDNKYLDRPREQLRIYFFEDKRPLVHALGNEGAELLKNSYGRSMPESVYWTNKNRLLKDNRFFKHRLGIADFYISLQTVLSKEPLVRLIDEDEVLGLLPQAAQRLKHPLTLPTKFRWVDGSMMEHATIPDGIFAIEDHLSDEDEGKFLRSFFFFEFDTSSENLVSSGKKQSSIVQKMLGYADVRSKGIHKTRFGYKNFRVLFVTSSRERIENMQKRYEQYCRIAIPAGAFLFATHEDILEHSPLGDVWVNAENTPVVLVPKLSSQ